MSVAENVAEIQANAQTAAAGLQAGAEQGVALTNTDAQKTIAQLQATTQTGIATRNNQTEIQVATIEAANRIDVTKAGNSGGVQQAQIGADAQRYSADVSREAQVETATIDATNKIQVADKNNSASVQVAEIDATARLQVAEIQQSAGAQQSQIDANARIAVAEIDSAAQHYSADQQVAATQIHEAAETGRLTTKINYVEEKFQLAYGLAQAEMDTINAGGIGTPGLLSIDSAPYVSTRGVFTPAQVQAQVNQAYAQNDSRTVSQIRASQGDLAGRGFSSNSPLLDALRVGYLGQNLAANNGAATAIRLQSAQANAAQITQGQSLAVNRWQAQQNVALDSEKNAIQRQVGLLGAVAQMVGGVS